MTKLSVHLCAQHTMTALVIISGVRINTVMSLRQMKAVLMKDQFFHIGAFHQQHQWINWYQEMCMDSAAKEKYQERDIGNLNLVEDVFTI